MVARFGLLGVIGGAALAVTALPACNGGGGDPMASDTSASGGLTVPGDTDSAPTGALSSSDTTVSGGTSDVPTGVVSTDSSGGPLTIDSSSGDAAAAT
jgi:hypothetical protein